MASVLELINNSPALLIFVYLAIEAAKVYLPHKASKDKNEEHARDEITDAVFKMYGLAKSDLESDKVEIRELTRLLKRANLEITLLERKIAALMRVMDSVLKDIPEAHVKYIESMSLYKSEVEELTSSVIGDADFDQI